MGRRLLPAVFGACALTAAAGASPGITDQSPDLSKNHLVATAAAYVTAYQKQFAFLIADEATVQHAVGTEDAAPEPAATRTTRGEIFLTFLEGRNHWTAVRDVAEVDGRPVADRVDLPALLNREGTDAVARRLLAVNARYNLGRITRNFNDPMIGLLPLSDAHRARFSFDVDAVDRRQPGMMLATLSFRERARPTLVRSASGGAAYARGSVTMEATTGVIRRTQFTVRYDTIDAELVTEFARDDRLGLWVPSTLAERYTARARDREDEVTSTSAYSNYRRFEVTGRLLGLAPGPD
jgi:hypothetical protein